MIDWDRIRELRNDIGADNFNEVINLFFDEADRAVAHLAGRLSAPALAAQLHNLKGAALNLGFERLADLCRQNEDRAVGGDGHIDIYALRDAYAEVRRSYDRGAAPDYAS